eukprot:416977_1
MIKLQLAKKILMNIEIGSVQIPLYAIIIVGVIIIIFVWIWLLHTCYRVKIPKMSLEEKNVLITGGSEGIGLCTAKEFVSKGCNVAILARNAEKLEKAARELRELRINPVDQQIITISCDVSNYKLMEENIITAFEENKWDEVDVIICNAGVEEVKSLQDSRIEDYHHIMNVNYFGAVNTIKISLPYLKKNKKEENKYGRIIINCSLLGIMGMGYYSAYCSSKWALRGFVESIFSELAAYNIYISIVYPPDVKTASLEREKQINIPSQVKELSDNTGIWDPQIVGNGIMSMIEKGEYNRSWGIDGWMLINLTAGFTIPTSLLDTFAQLLCLGLFRTISMFYIKNIYKVCKTSFNVPLLKEDSNLTDNYHQLCSGNKNINSQNQL